MSERHSGTNGPKGTAGEAAPGVGGRCPAAAIESIGAARAGGPAFTSYPPAARWKPVRRSSTILRRIDRRAAPRAVLHGDREVHRVDGGIRSGQPVGDGEEGREGRGRQRLVPVGGAAVVVAPVVGMPVLDADAQAFMEDDRVGDVVAVDGDPLVEAVRMPRLLIGDAIVDEGVLRL